MRSIDLYTAVRAVDDDILERSETASYGQKKNGWLKWCAVAACLCLVAGIAVTGILRSHLISPNDVLHEPEQYRAIMWEDVPSTEPFGSLFPTEIIEGYVLENDVALYGEGTASVLQARFFNEQLGDELVITVYAKDHYGDEPLNKVIYGDGHSFKGSMIVINGGDYVVRYSTGRDIVAISGFEDMVKSARQLFSWTMTQELPDKGSAPTEYPDTTIVPGFDLDEPSEPAAP